MPIPTQTLPSFNCGRPLRVLRRLSDGALGVVDEAHVGVWWGHAFVSTPLAPDEPTEEVPLLRVPSKYGSWARKSIGGVSDTVRRSGVLRARPRIAHAVTLFALRAPDADVVRSAIAARCGGCAEVVGTEHDATFGHVSEIRVSDSDYAAMVAACVARTGAEPIWEDPSVDALRTLGVERLDRIDAAVSDEGYDDPDSYGLKRGIENWRFQWMPPDWNRVPITWDHLVANVVHVQSIDVLPQPLRQHVARERLKTVVVGTDWTEAGLVDVEEGEAAEGSNANCFNSRVVVRVTELQEALGQGRRTFEIGELVAWDMFGMRGAWRYVCRGTDGVWYRPVDTYRALERHIPRRRFVSAALKPAQSRQLIEAFYALNVERIDDASAVGALNLVMYRYMIERGYTARWMGKYVQEALNVGNGDLFRKFRAELLQYGTRANQKPVVYRKLAGRDGKFHTRGSKGSRSKHALAKKRWVPQRRLVRTVADEARMREDL